MKRNISRVPSWPRYHSAAVILPPSDGAQDRFIMLFGGKDDWRRLNDLWWLRLKSVQVSTVVPSAAKGNKTFPVHGVWHGTSRPDSCGGWSLAEARRDERCAHTFVSGTAKNAWQVSCGALASGDGKDTCTMRMVLEMAWCIGEYQGIGRG